MPERAARKVAYASKELLVEAIQRSQVQRSEKKAEGNPPQGIYNTGGGGK